MLMLNEEIYHETLVSQRSSSPTTNHNFANISMQSRVHITSITLQRATKINLYLIFVVVELFASKIMFLNSLHEVRIKLLLYFIHFTSKN